MRLKNLSVLILLSILIIIIGSFRFNRNDSGISKFTLPNSKYDPIKSNDAIRYINMTDFYKGKESSEILIPPYTTRVLVPFLASKLPFSTDTSINIINLVSMVLSLYVLYYILKIYSLPDKYIYLGCLLYVFSFPTFYYGTVTYVDAVLVFFIFSGLYFILKDKTIFLFLTIILGTCVKESMVLLIPVYFIYEISQSEKKTTALLKTISLTAVYFLTTYFLHYIKPNKLSYMWIPTYEVFISNISRLRTFMSFILTFGIPGILSLVLTVYFFLKDRSVLKKNMILISGIIVSFCLWVYSVISAYSDGRFIWPSIVFSIPLSMILINYFINNKMKYSA